MRREVDFWFLVIQLELWVEKTRSAIRNLSKLVSVRDLQCPRLIVEPWPLVSKGRFQEIWQCIIAERGYVSLSEFFLTTGNKNWKWHCGTCSENVLWILQLPVGDALETGVRRFALFHSANSCIQSVTFFQTKTTFILYDVTHLHVVHLMV